MCGAGHIGASLDTVSGIGHTEDMDAGISYEAYEDMCPVCRSQGDAPCYGPDDYTPVPDHTERPRPSNA